MALQMKPYRVNLQVPDEETRYRSLFFIAVGNGLQTGGGIQVAPKALLNDGVLDVLGVRRVEPMSPGKLMGELIKIGAPDNQYVVYRQLSSFTIESMDWFQFNLDGEPVQGTSFHFSMLPRCLLCVLPPTAPISDNIIG